MFIWVSTVALSVQEPPIQLTENPPYFSNYKGKLLGLIFLPPFSWFRNFFFPVNLFILWIDVEE